MLYVRRKRKLPLPLGEGWGEGDQMKQADKNTKNAPVIFIDANIYLTFYKSSKQPLGKLLSRLMTIKNHIFCPTPAKL